MRSRLIWMGHAEGMTKTRRPHLTTAFALALALGLSACGGAGESSDGVNAEEPTSPVEMTDDAAVETSDDSTSDENSTATTDDDSAAGSSAPAAGADAGDDVTAAALAAIATAEGSAGGTAYEIDDQDDDGTWEVDVAVGDRSVEVTLSADGSEVVATSDDSLDSDDAAAVDAAQVTLIEAIEAAIAEAGGVVDSASLDEDDGTYRYDVELDRTDRGDDIEVLVDAVTGDVIAIDT